jgi:nicotinamide mononucleotide transporter
MGLVAEWLICRKVIEAWLIWGFVNTLLVGLYFYKGIPVHASEELVYIALSVIGYSQWLRRLSGSVESSGASKAYGDQV